MNIENTYKEGYTLYEISEQTHLTNSQVENFLNSLNKEIIYQHRLNLQKRIRQMFNEGLTEAAISKKTAVSLSIVKSILH